MTAHRLQTIRLWTASTLGSHRDGGNQRVYGTMANDRRLGLTNPTLPPRYITATRSDTWRIARRSRDEQVRQVFFTFQLLEEIHDLTLDRNIQRGNRFIGNDEILIDREARAMPIRCLAHPRIRGGNA